MKFFTVLLVSIVYGNISIANEPVLICEYSNRGNTLNSSNIRKVFSDMPETNMLHICRVNTEIVSIELAGNIERESGITFSKLTDILQLERGFLSEPFYLKLAQSQNYHPITTLVCRDTGSCNKHSSERFISIGDMTPSDYSEFRLSWNKAMSNVGDFSRKSKAVKKIPPSRKMLQDLIKNGANFTILEISTSAHSTGGYGMTIHFEVDGDPYWSISATFANNILKFGYVNS